MGFQRTTVAVLLVLLTVAATTAGDAHAQRSRAGDTWAFGTRCRMTWSAAGDFTFAQDPVIATDEGSAAVSDATTGALLLYSDGIRVWDAAGVAVVSNLPGDPSSMHAAVIVPAPGAAGEYYVFAHGASMSSAVGYQRFAVGGTVTAVGTQASIALPAGQGREGMLHIPHRNGVDAWVLVAGASSIFVLPVTAAGVGAAQEVTSGLSIWPAGWHVFAASAQGTTVVMSGNSSIDPSSAGDLVAWTFDPATGQLSDRRVLNAGYRVYQMYGGAFSPGGRRFYFSVLDDSNGASGLGRFLQYDLDSGSFTALATGPSRYYHGDARRGPDGRIYVASTMGNRLHVVDEPDRAGTAAAFQVDAVTPPPGCSVRLGLPQTPLPLALLPPTIDADPVSATVFATQPLALAVAASGEQLAYQWRKDGVDLPGATAATFATTAAVADAGSYTVTVSNPAGAVTSAAAAVVVHGPPAITADPTAATVFATQPLALAVAASGEQLAYQWRKDGVDLPGATAATFATTAAVADAGSYTVTVSNPAGAVTSAAAAVVVHGPPAITTQPEDRTVVAGAPLALGVGATGEQLAYQWRRDGADLTGETSPTLTLTAASSGDAGRYSVVVTNPAGTVTSAEAVVVVVPVDEPPPDEREGCGCRGGPTPSAPLIALVLWWVAGRRRRLARRAGGV